MLRPKVPGRQIVNAKDKFEWLDLLGVGYGGFVRGRKKASDLGGRCSVWFHDIVGSCLAT